MVMLVQSQIEAHGPVPSDGQVRLAYHQRELGPVRCVRRAHRAQGRLQHTGGAALGLRRHPAGHAGEPQHHDALHHGGGGVDRPPGGGAPRGGPEAHKRGGGTRS
eukprot:1181390-Prorocentrum_minimum.AAC.2